MREVCMLKLFAVTRCEPVPLLEPLNPEPHPGPAEPEQDESRPTPNGTQGVH